MIIEPRHFEYLVIQRGEVSDQRHDFEQWKLAYLQSLGEIAKSIWPVLPNECERILDVGSGLGGIDLILSRRYKAAQFDLLDGTDFKPYVYNHNIPFSNGEVAIDFHQKNGNSRVECIWPRVPAGRQYDLVISFAAFCFHIAPVAYLDQIIKAVKPTTRLIFEVRRERSDWLKNLIQAFGKPVVLARREKFTRLGFRCEQQSSSVADGLSSSTTSQT